MHAKLFFVCGLMAAISSVALGYAAGQFRDSGATDYWQELVLALIMALVAGGAVLAGLRCQKPKNLVFPKPADPTRKHCQHFGMPD